MSSLLLTVLAGLSLHIESPQRTVVVGEPLKLVARMRVSGASGMVVVPPLPDFSEPVITFLVNDGTRERRYAEFPRGHGVAVRLRLSQGEEIGRTLVLLQGGYVPPAQSMAVPELLFAKPGEYALKAEYASNGSAPPVYSNEVRVRVRAPRGVEAEILSFSETNRLVLDAAGSTDDQNRRTAELMNRYPESPYLRWARLRDLTFKDVKPESDDEREAMVALERSDPGAYDRQVRLKYAERAKAVLDFSHWGPFEEDALALAYRFARSSQDENLAREVRERLLGGYPGSIYAAEVSEASDR
jgi:hypothetical protein